MPTVTSSVWSCRRYETELPPVGGVRVGKRGIALEASALHAPSGLGRITAHGPLLRVRSDDQLVALFRMGYDDAFRAIHDRYRQRLFAYTRQMLGGSRSDAEDVLQDVFLRAYGALRHDDRPVTLRAWLYRVAHNRCIDHLRRPVPPAAEVYELSRTPQHDPPGETERREDLRELVKDVQRLPEQQRSALLMRELDGLSYAELADALRTSVPAVKSLLVRARIGLVESGEARDTACADIRAEIALAYGRGVRASGRSRRHLRDCSGCREYRHALRGRRTGFAALGSGGPLATLAKLLGIGGASSGAAAGAGGSAVVVGGAATATKVAAIVCCAAVVGGGAVEVGQHVTAVKPTHHKAVVHPRATPAARAAAATAPVRVVPLAAPAGRVSNPLLGHDAPTEAKHSRAAGRSGTSAQTVHREEPAALSTPAVTTPAAPEEIQTGGAMAPDEDSMPGPSDTGGNGAPEAPDATNPAATTPPAPGSELQSTTPQPPAPVDPTGTTAGGAPVTG
jgi:RNA polymerase sigma factor (sigma-70 family)